MENHGHQKITSEQDCSNYMCVGSTSSSSLDNRQINDVPQKTTKCNKRSRSRLSATSSSQSRGHPCNSRLFGCDPLACSRTVLPVPAHLFGSLASSTDLSSSNDNNNCNKSRRASYSTAIETQQHSSSQHPFHCIGIPAYVPNPYFDLQKQCNLKISNCATAPLPIILPTCRRSSTTAVFQDTSDPHLQPMSSFHPQYLSCQQSRSHKILQPHPYIYSHHNRVLSQVSFRRDRHSVGGPLTTIESASNIVQHQHSMVPVVQVPVSNEVLTEQTTSVDEDDVFDDSLPISTLNSTTDPLFYREKLRESRKRSMNTPSLTSRNKYLCHSNGVMPSNVCSRFKIHAMKNDDSNMPEEAKRHSTVDFSCEIFLRSDQDMPGTSRSHPVEISSSYDASKKEVLTSNDDRDNQHLKLSSTSKADPQLKTSSVHGLTLCPILKNAKSRKNQKYLPVKSDKVDEVQSSQQQGPFAVFDGNSCTRGLKKKQVAWKDVLTKKEKIESLCKDIDDNTTNMIKYDLLTEQSLSMVKHNQSNFSTKDQIGPYLFGPQLGTSPVLSIKQFLVRKKGSFKYFMAKVLNMTGSSCDDKSGRMLLYSEHSLLTFLKDHPGVIREHGFHKDLALNPTTGKKQERLCLILDCLTSHSFDPETDDYDNLQQYLIKVKKMSERETVRIFMSIVKIVHSLHDLNIVHRDLKLGNMVLLRKSKTIILTNFGLGRHLISDGELLKDRRGSPAYISPDVLSNKPYTGKPSDMWSLGVVLFMMLYRQFPFYDQEPKKLFEKIKKVDFVLPSNTHISSQINEVIYGLLTFDPAQRLTAGETLSALHRCASSWNRIQFSQLDDHVVPDINNDTLSDDEEKEQMEIDEKSSEEKSTDEFRSGEEDFMEKRMQGFGRQSRQSTLPTIQYCVYDARPLAEDEMVMHRRLLVNSSSGVRVQEIR